MNFANGALTEAVYYILLSLLEPRHGYGIMQNAESLSNGRVKLAAGTLYGALNTLLEKGWITALPGEKNSRKKEYVITETGRETLRQEAYFDTWLIRILINQCKTFYRRRPPEPAELTEDIPQVTSEETPLLEALMALPRKQRVTLELHYIEGYSVAETARILRLPEGTVKWRLKRGRELLKQSLNREEARA